MEENKKRVSVAMAAYNGLPYIREQVISILNGRGKASPCQGEVPSGARRRGSAAGIDKMGGFW